MNNIKKKSPKNKTIDISIEDGREYLSRCISLTSKQENMDLILNKTILGDTFEVMKNIPEKSIDLIIAESPL